MSRPNNNRNGLFSLFSWYLLLTAKYAAARMHIHGSASSTYVYCGLNVDTVLPRTSCIFSIVVFALGFPGEAGLVLIPYYFQ